MAKAKLPPNLEPELLAKAGEGLSTRQLSDWLLANHGVTLGQSNVSRLLKKLRVERSEITRAVVREKLGPAVISDIDVLAMEQKRASDLSRRLHERANTALDGEVHNLVELYADLALKASDRVRAITDRKLHFAGAGEVPGGDSSSPVHIFLPPEEE